MKSETLAKKPPTLRDVARESGVSPFTVSAVLNGARSNTQVSAATRKRIQESAERLNYYPNAVARSLARQRTNLMGVLFGVPVTSVALANWYASGLLQGIVAEASEHQLDLLLYTKPWTDDGAATSAFRDRRSDGLVVIAPLLDSDMLTALATLRLAMVVIAPEYATCPPAVPAVDIDNERGITLAVDHLVELGHRRIAHLTGEANMGSVPIRRAAFCRAMARHGLVVPDGYLVTGTYHGDTVPQDLARLMALPESPTALVAGNDNIALAALNAAREMGIDVPGALSVTGFDDVPAASQVHPTLTTLRQPLNEIGALAARLLSKEIAQRQPGAESVEADEEPATNLYLIPPELVIRGSTGPPPTNRRS